MTAVVDTFLLDLKEVAGQNTLEYIIHEDSASPSTAKVIKNIRKVMKRTLEQEGLQTPRNPHELFTGRHKALFEYKCPKLDEFFSKALQVTEATTLNDFSQYTSQAQPTETGALQPAEIRILEDVGAAVSDERALTMFACGGRVFRSNANEIDKARTSVTIRWDSPAQPSKVARLTLAEGRQDGLQQLLNDCRPITFGDNKSCSTRRELEEGQFSTDFCPYKSHIIDTLEQSIAPNVTIGACKLKVKKSHDVF